MNHTTFPAVCVLCHKMSGLPSALKSQHGVLVVNDSSAPYDVPATLLATKRKWYVAPLVSPLMYAPISLPFTIRPTYPGLVAFPYAVVVPHSNHSCESAWPALIMPCSIAAVLPTFDAGFVSTVGGTAVAVVWSAP